MSIHTYDVPGISCGHCRTAIAREVNQIDGVATVDVDLIRKIVTVTGADVRDDAVREAIDTAGYDVA
jgi:copper chaperone CopZ